MTLEDIFEELVGEIEDEFDLPDDSLVRVDEVTVRVAGSMTIDDFNETPGTQMDDSDRRGRSVSQHPDALGEGRMQTPTVAEISRECYVEAQKAWHKTQLRLVRESLFRDREADVTLA